MSYFDLLFLASVLLTVVTLVAAGVSAIRGRRGRAAKILKAWGIYVAFYMTVALAFDFLRPQRVLQVGDPWCFDDWCLTVEAVEIAPAQSDIAYGVRLRISSEARRVEQRAAGAWIYLIDDAGRRYSPENDPSAVALDVKLRPQQSVETSRVFRVPLEAKHLGLITGHGGPYCGAMSVLIIGEGGCLFNKPTMIQILPTVQP